MIHYGEANQSDPQQATFMGYSETNEWSLATANVPELQTGDKIYFYVQAYNEVGVGSDDSEKARYLHDGEFIGSAWSDPVILTK